MIIYNHCIIVDYQCLLSLVTQSKSAVSRRSHIEFRDEDLAIVYKDGDERVIKRGCMFKVLLWYELCMGFRFMIQQGTSI